jgi:iron complex outermembrane receptor protein
MRRTARLALLTSLSTIAFMAAPALAQDNAAPADPATDAIEEDVAPQDAIIVTGTRRTDRTVADSPVPIDVISADQLTQSGFTEVNRLLNQQVPSFNFPQPAITDGTDVIRPATLRGLSPDQTLVLLNGKRRHTTALLNINGSVGRGSAAVDINLIPLDRAQPRRSAARRRGGAIRLRRDRGVINFQLSDRREGGRITLNAGYYNTSVQGIREVTGVQTGANGQPTLAADGTYNLQTTGRDRRAKDGETFTIAGILGLPIGPEGHITISAEYQDRNRTNRTGYDPRRQYALIAGAVDPRELTFDRLSHRYGDPATQDLKLFVNSGLPLGDSAELYAFGTYGYRDGPERRLLSNPERCAERPAIYPNGFLPKINTELDDLSITGGVRGEVGRRLPLRPVRQRREEQVRLPDHRHLEPFVRPSSPTSFDSGGLRYSQTMVNLDVSKDLALGFAEKTTLSGGVEYRRETFRIRPGEPGSYQAAPSAARPVRRVSRASLP